MATSYLTTPIYYVNDAPHLGHAYTTVLADALARWGRLHGDDVRLVTGTDEYGLKVQRAAAAAGVEPQVLADTNSARFQTAWSDLGVRPDDFLRTTQQRHVAAVQHFLQRIHDNGYVDLRRYSGPYCVACEAYYADSEVPDGQCPIHRRPVEQISEDNYFFRLSAFADQLLDHYERHPDAIRPAARRNEALSFIRQGLRDFSISRTSISWGVPLPWDRSHVAYVWADALVSYLTAAGYPDGGHERWWAASRHIIGKDILRFHCVYWPALLLAAGLAPPRQVDVHGFLLIGGEKMSKSRIGAIAPAELTADVGVDGLRYHLLRDNPFGPDGEFSHEGLVARYNADLANTLGNLLSRVCALVVRRCAGVGPAPSPAASTALAGAAERAYAESAQAWAQPQPSAALAAVWRLVAATNSYLVAHEPWAGGPDRILGDALEALRIIAVLASPVIPDAAGEILRRIGLSDQPGSRPGVGPESRLPAAAVWGGYPGGLPVRTGTALFPRFGVKVRV